MTPLIQQLLATTPVVTDGAWGTELQAAGLEIGQCPDIWNLAHPDRVARVAQAYVDVGCQIILTNTFGANRIRLAECGAASDVRAINLRGAEISRQAAANRAKVFGSIGPSGKLLLMGDVTEEELRIAFAEQAHALKEGGVDGLVIETMSDLDEARIALAAAQETALPIVVSMAFDPNGRTMTGVVPAEAARALSAAGADVIGANCGNGIAAYVPICRQLHAATALPIWIKANAGLPQIVDGRVTYQISPATFARHVRNLVDAGADFVGGCCGTTPAHLAATVKAVRDGG